MTLLLPTIDSLQNAQDQIPDSGFPLKGDIIRDFSHVMDLSAELIVVAVEENCTSSRMEQGRFYHDLAGVWLAWLEWFAFEIKEILEEHLKAEALNRPPATNFAVQCNEARSILRQTFCFWSQPSAAMTSHIMARLSQLLHGLDVTNEVTVAARRDWKQSFSDAVEHKITPHLFRLMQALYLTDIDMNFETYRQPAYLAVDTAASICALYMIFEAPHRWRKRASEYALVTVAPALQQHSTSLQKPIAIVISAAVSEAKRFAVAETHLFFYYLPVAPSVQSIDRFVLISALLLNYF